MPRTHEIPAGVHTLFSLEAGNSRTGKATAMVSLKKPGYRRLLEQETILLAAFEAQSRPGNEVWVMEQVVQFLAPLRLPAPLLDRLKTAVAETSMNAMEHGNHFKDDQPIEVAILLNKECILIRISDQGSAMDISGVEIPDLDAKLAGKQSPRGWGMFLIQSMVDELRTIPDDSRHTIELVFFRRHRQKRAKSAGI